MYNLSNIKKTREELYEDVWSMPMTDVAEKYGISDNGVRKRCKSLNIPMPPLGYWQKFKVGKPVPERTPLPPYDTTVISFDTTTNGSNDVESNSKKKFGAISLIDLDDITIAQMEEMKGFDLLTPSSVNTFREWCNSLVVPKYIKEYDNLISKHKSELEYREARDKAYPFRGDRIDFWNPGEKIKDRNDEPVIPIKVSKGMQNRAYRIIQTLIKAFQDLKCRIEVQHIEKDNISITVLDSVISFELYETKIKRRYMADRKAIMDFRPLYEEVYSGILEINFYLYKGWSNYKDTKRSDITLTYRDTIGNPLENQIPTILSEIYIQCCNNKINAAIDKRIWQENYEKEKAKQLEKEREQIRRELEEKQKKLRQSLINDISKKADIWFECEKLSRYANELELYLNTCSDKEITELLQEYLRILRDYMKDLRPLDDIIQTMRMIKNIND